MNISLKSAINVKVVPSLHGGLPTATFTTPDGHEYYLHSKYDPIAEAEHWVSTIPVQDRTLYVILGFGLGYHVKALLKKIPQNSSILVIESQAESLVPQMIEYFKSRKEKWFSDPRLQFHAYDDPQAFCFSVVSTFIQTQAKTIKLITHIPSATMNKMFYSETAQSIQTEFTSILYSNLLSIERSVENNLTNLWCNLPTIWQNPSVDHLSGKWRGQPAIIVSAGPSLNNNILLLKKAKTHALIICVGTAAKALAKHNIEPDFIISIDPFEVNAKHFQEWDTKKIPLIMYSKIARAIPEQYQGEKFWLTMRGDDPIPLAPAKHQPFFYIGGTVAFSALQFAYHVQADPVIFMGQDLAFADGLSHADGTTFMQKVDEDSPPPDHLWVPGNKGVPVLTTPAMYKYLQFMQGVIAGQKNILHINATEGGARIDGMQVLTLAQALDLYCQREINNPKNVIRDVKTRFTPVEAKKMVKLLNTWVSQLEDFHRTTHDCVELDQLIAAFKRTDVYTVNRKGYDEVFYNFEIQQDLLSQDVTHPYAQNFKNHCRFISEQLQHTLAEMRQVTL
jgi:hypothetical protein